MIDPESIEALDAATFSSQFIRPLYNTYSFAQIPQTIRYLLTESDQKGVPFGARDDLYQKYDTVILFLIDAFGWCFFERFYDRSPFLKRIVDQGLVCKLTSQFPSTTAAHVTTIHTGLQVGQSGVYEWFYYEPLLDVLIAPLLFAFAGDKERNTLQRTGVAAADLYPTQTLHQDLKLQGVQSVLLQPQHIAFSPYSKVVTKGAKIVPYRTLPEALVLINQLILEQTERTYYFLYFDNIDSICHWYGPQSPQVEAEIDLFLYAMEQIFHKSLTERASRTLFLMTADHGQIAIDPATTVYLNRSLPEAQRYMRTNRAGQPLVPAGSSRDMFLYIKEEYLDEAQSYLQEKLDGRAEIYRVQELIEQQFFGFTTSPAFLGRVGNLVILPYPRESVWWFEQGRFQQPFYGSHGGLTREEMETLLLVLPYG